jgi:alpha-amylase
MRSTMPDSKRYINLYFQVHQPRRLRRFQFFDIGSAASYYDDVSNRDIICRVAQQCYQPANEMLLRLIKRYPNIRITFSLSGTVIEQLKAFSPATLKSFKQLVYTGAVEILGETYYHSLASMINSKEFVAQVEAHRQTIINEFAYIPTVFRNTELLYSNDIGKQVFQLGFKGMYLDGIESVLHEKNTNTIYHHSSAPLALFPRNYRLSDDIAFRYSDQSWSEWPLTAQTFLRWVNHIPSTGDVVTLGIDYETLGEHQKSEGGILEFMERVLGNIAVEPGLIFANPSDIIHRVLPKGTLSAKEVISWADHERDLSAWLGNDMQADAFRWLKKLQRRILKTGNAQLLKDCRYLQTSDHFYYMSTKNGSDGDVHQYFSPYSSPYEAYMNFMNVLSDLEYRVKHIEQTKTIEKLISVKNEKQLQ